ncbi:hypothetical protein MRX96_040637 [Rhipicephalus microplus]
MKANLTLVSALAKARLKETVQGQQQQVRETSDEPLAAPASNLDAVNKQQQPRKNSSGQRSRHLVKDQCTCHTRSTHQTTVLPTSQLQCMPQLQPKGAPEDLLPGTSCERQLLRLFRTFRSGVCEKGCMRANEGTAIFYPCGQGMVYIFRRHGRWGAL